MPNPVTRVENLIIFPDGMYRPLTLRERFVLWAAAKIGAQVILPRVSQ